jgi:exonuclease III
MDCTPEILDWNVHGLNDPAKRDAFREFVAQIKVSVVCLQETKLEFIDEFVVRQCLGPSFDRFKFLPAEGTRGGILLAWDSVLISISHISMDTYAITGEVRTLAEDRWWLSTIYGPQATND